MKGTYMCCRNWIKVFTFILLSSGQMLLSQIVLQGTVTDNGAEFLGNGAEPIENALVTLTDQADANRTFSSTTNAQGEYVIQIYATGVDDPIQNIPVHFNLSQNYPNPFNPTTVIGYELTKPAAISIEIYNVLGQKIRTLLDGYQAARSGQVIWDATNDLGQGVPAGLYIYSLKAAGIRINKKMLLIDGHQGNSNMTMSNTTGTEVSSQSVLNKQMSDQYLFRVTGDNIESYEQQNLEITGNITLDITVIRTVTDIDGNVYRTVKIGNQWWLAENLKVTQYSNGDAIPNVTGSTEWENLSTGAYCNYDNDVNNVDTYGRMYNWYAVDDSRNIAPEGWHVPSDAEWQILSDYLGGEWVAGGKMKVTGTEYWNSPNEGATNESDFSALPSGWRAGNSNFNDMGRYAYFWSSTEYGSSDSWYWYIYYKQSILFRSIYWSLRSGFSVRCLRD